MNTHFLPRYYLRGFCEHGSDDMLWQCDKNDDAFRRVSLATAGTETNSYFPKVEQELADLVESPANSVIDKLRKGLPIEEKDRFAMAVYIATMFMRVPSHRKYAENLAPGVVNNILADVKLTLEWGLQAGIANPEVAAKRFSELATLEKKFQKQLPLEMLKAINAPWPSQKVVQIVLQMTWRFVTTDGPSFFQTSDNPAFMFDAFGLRHDEAEPVFPLSSGLRLHSCWQQLGHGEPRIREVPQSMVKEFNRRVASRANRFVYYHKQESWIRTRVRKPKPYLSRIRW